VLSVTGFYNGAPFLYGDGDTVIIAYTRFAQFVAAFIFTTCVLVRMYWWFTGNKYARINQFIPTTAERIENTLCTAMFYAFCKKDLPHSPGHTGLAGVSYFFLFGLYIVEIITGFAMLTVAHGGGAFWTIMGGWSLGIMSVAYLRLIHHLIMWVIWLFVIAHVYISWHNDLIEKNGLISSIFSGYKNMEEDH